MRWNEFSEQGGLHYQDKGGERRENFKHFFYSLVYFPPNQKEDKVVPLLPDSSEEGQKVSRQNGVKYLAVFRRVALPGVESP